MAISKAMLEGMGLSSEQVKAILSEHFSTVEGLEKDAKDAKEEAKTLREKADNADALAKQLKELQDKVAKEAKENEGKDYDALKKEFDDYKAEQERKEVRAAKETAYKEILKDAGIAEKHFAKILKYSDVDGVELDEKGKITTAKDILKAIKEEWSDHIQQQDTRGTGAENPPTDNRGIKGMTIEQIDAIEDAGERQKAMYENRELFGL